MAHIHEKIDFVADTYVIHDGTVLLRVHDKYKMWLPPGGHIELHEDPVEAAVREVKEETGLDVELVGDVVRTEEDRKNLLVPRFMHRHKINAVHEHIALVYFAVARGREVVEGDEERSGGMKWFTKEELFDPQYGITKTVQHYALAALEAVKK